MNAVLPDVSRAERAAQLGQLEWVGMQGIDLPVTLAERGCPPTLHARADVQVDLPAAHVKGIHMSRLYRLVDSLGEGQALSPAGLHQLLQAMADSHQDCASGNARLSLDFDLLTRRPALVSEHLAGWKAYPVSLEATLIAGTFSLQAQVGVTYSSTCPCSAALSRQLVEHAFAEAFVGQQGLSVEDVAAWLREHATLATPHSQRSVAQVRVQLGEADELQLLALVERIEQALGTPVQTAVKRADEQAFAALNGSNLMFVEDAARRIQHALAGHYSGPRVHVRHLESLHPHDASAWAGPLVPPA
ncbi:GTP cyclohydrolase [Pseudomonas sp. PA15(2017)]|uniref:GTP cyclohydrolase FolE2 n=1 Tax=Pseudomonas sp. PA15(2017) TaxID=1932111 RepID=UPI00095D3072|nr:GTP cyclohydrolase FolE2 [Pseudomonas sp. PA15(2017)]OLU22378.1 GTP cyclohydrolase [Pseudomonas sp. PA15(2017)]